MTALLALRFVVADLVQSFVTPLHLVVVSVLALSFVEVASPVDPCATLALLSSSPAEVLFMTLASPPLLYPSLLVGLHR